jgi:DNA-binding NarL/FixJ family response regulator
MSFPPIDPSAVRLPVRVVVLADVRLYREGLARILGDYAAIALVGIGPTDRDTLARTAAEVPDVVLLEAAAACNTTIVDKLAKLAPDARVLAYGVVDEDRQALRCAEVGVAGFVPSHATGEDLVDAVLGIARGEFRCSPRVAALLVKRVSALSHGLTPEHSHGQLTPRERAIVTLIDEGLSNKLIACRLSISLSTVKNHVHHILEKLQASRRTQAAAQFRRERLT